MYSRAEVWTGRQAKPPDCETGRNKYRRSQTASAEASAWVETPKPTRLMSRCCNKLQLSPLSFFFFNAVWLLIFCSRQTVIKSFSFQRLYWPIIITGLAGCRIHNEGIGTDIWLLWETKGTKASQSHLKQSSPLALIGEVSTRGEAVD